MITVRITAAELFDANMSNVCFTAWLLERLRKAGIPVRGVLLYDGLERGVLTETRDILTGDITYCWKG